MEQESLNKFYKEDIILTKEYFIDDSSNISLSELVKKMLAVSYDHDEYYRDYLHPYLLQDGQTWIITHNEFNFLGDLKKGEEATIETAVISLTNLFVERRFRVLKADKVLAEVFMQFAALDLNTRKLVRISQPNIEQSYWLADIPHKFNRIREFKDAEREFKKELIIKETDIDDNYHVNNAVYINWYQELFTEDFLSSYEPLQFHIKYNTELMYEDEAELRTQVRTLEDGSVELYSQIYNLTEDKLANQARMLFAKI